MYKFGTIVLIPFPFTDLTSTKIRPALIISMTDAKSDDVIVCFISSKLNNAPKVSHYILRDTDLYFRRSGLKTASVFRFDKLATLNKKLILGELGSLHPVILQQMQKAFQGAFGF